MSEMDKDEIDAKKDEIDAKEKEERKYRFTTKTWFYLGGLVGLLAFIVVSAVWDLTFGTFDAVSFVADTLILVAISLGSLVLSEMFSKEFNMNKIHGVYNVACNEYLKAMALVDGIKIYFSQFFYWFLERETERKRVGYLILSGIQPHDAKRIVRFAKVDDAEQMLKCKRKAYVRMGDDGKEIVLPTLETEEQAAAVRQVLKGLHDIKETSYSDYLYINDISEANMSIIERKKYLERRMAANRRRSYILSIIRLIGTAAVMAALVPADPEESTANKWWLLFKRIGVFCTSFLTGWNVGSKDVIAQAAIINDKTNFIVNFRKCHELGEWKPKSEDELEAEIIAEYRKEQEEAKESVVEPEVVAEPNLPPLIGGAMDNEN